MDTVFKDFIWKDRVIPAFPWKTPLFHPEYNRRVMNEGVWSCTGLYIRSSKDVVLPDCGKIFCWYIHASYDGRSFRNKHCRMDSLSSKMTEPHGIFPKPVWMWKQYIRIPDPNGTEHNRAHLYPSKPSRMLLRLSRRYDDWRYSNLRLFLKIDQWQHKGNGSIH